jgi:hypothetical protein
LGTFAELAVFWEKSSPNDADGASKNEQNVDQGGQAPMQKDQEISGGSE